MARYLYPSQKTEAMKMQQVAYKKNMELLHPMESLDYSKITFASDSRSNRICELFRKYNTFEELFLQANAILKHLEFGEPSNDFEKSLKDIGKLLGFESQRPEKEIKKGPDNLWCIASNEYILFECKNMVDEKRNFISKAEVGQLSNSIAWFNKEYKNANVKFVMVTPGKKLADDAFIQTDISVLGKKGLISLVKNTQEFVKDLKGVDIADISESEVIERLKLHNLDNESIKKMYWVEL